MLVNFKRLKGWDFFCFFLFCCFCFVLFFFIFFFEGGGLFQTMGLHRGGGRGLSLEKSSIMMGLGVFTDKCLWPFKWNVYLPCFCFFSDLPLHHHHHHPLLLTKINLFHHHEWSAKEKQTSTIQLTGFNLAADRTPWDLNVVLKCKLSLNVLWNS